jgi:cytidine deaminase
MRFTAESMVNWISTQISFKAICQRNNLRHNHVAVLIKRRKILMIATNALGSRLKGCGYDTRTIHAERAVIKKMGDYSKLEGTIMVVIKVSKHINEIGYSEPCHSCKCHLEKCMKHYGLKRIYYSI